MTLAYLSSTSRNSMAAFATAVGIGFGYVLWFRNRESNRVDVETLTYSDVVTYFVEHRPDDEQARRGALIRERRPNLWILSFVFLNDTDSICTGVDGKEYGQKLRVRKLDEEMVELFSGKDLVVFE